MNPKPMGIPRYPMLRFMEVPNMAKKKKKVVKIREGQQNILSSVLLPFMNGV
jgi:hypothetical protein